MEAEIALDPLVVQLIGGALIPIITGIITKLRSSTSVKASAALVLSVVVGTLSEVVTRDGVFTLRQCAEAAVVVFIAQLSAYQGIWKPIGDTNDVPGARATADFGIGSPQHE